MDKNIYPKKWYFNVVGNAMAGSRILNGDIVLIDEDVSIGSNDIVLVWDDLSAAHILRRVIEDADMSRLIIIGKVIEVRFRPQSVPKAEKVRYYNTFKNKKNP